MQKNRAARDKKQFFVGSEIGQLKKVILHRPELSLDRLTPSNCRDFLFDDIVRVEKACIEHAAFEKALEDNGVQCYLLRDLLEETLESNEAKRWVLDRQVSEYRYGVSIAQEIRSYFSQLNAKDMTLHLIGGLAQDELKLSKSNPVLGGLKDTDFLMDPLPNHLFTRDTSCWIYNGVCINPMAKRARRHESVHLGAVYKFHPMFKNTEFHFYCGNEDGDYERDYEWTSVEGGDVLVLGNQTVLIGISERTSAQGVVFLAKQLFKANQAERIIAVQLPKERSCMHLDTVLTQIDRDCFSYYDKVLALNKKLPLWELRPGKNPGKVESVHLQKTVKEAIEDALNLRKVRWIKTGGDKYQAEREQWNDANNLLAIRPGVAVAYNHNTSTIRKLEREGVKVVTIPGEDLGRGRGGPRCMSCPIEREAL